MSRNGPKRRTVVGSFFLFEPSSALGFLSHERLCCGERATLRSILLVPRGGTGRAVSGACRNRKNIMRNNTLYCEYLYLPIISRGFSIFPLYPDSHFTSQSPADTLEMAALGGRSGTRVHQ